MIYEMVDTGVQVEDEVVCICNVLKYFYYKKFIEIFDMIDFILYLFIIFE